MKNFKFDAAAMVLFFSALELSAAECRDEQLTKSIERVAARMPNLVECNLAIYRLPPDHPQFDAALKEGLIILKKLLIDGRPAT